MGRSQALATGSNRPEALAGSAQVAERRKHAKLRSTVNQFYLDRAYDD